MVRILFLFAGLQLFGAMVIANDDVTKLLDKLVEVTEPGFGYSAYFSVHLGLLWVVLEFSEKRTLEKRDGRQRTLPTHSWA